MFRIFVLLIGLFSGANLSAVTGLEVLAPQSPVPAPGVNFREAQNFAELRNQLIELISSSKRRVWLMTDYLTDGDLVSALYVAKYRRIDVRVFLGRSKQNSYLSRLNYLKAQNIPVYVRPEHGFVAPTLIFVDQRLYTINRDLNVLQEFGKANITQASPADVKAFVSWFRDILDNPEPTRPKPEIDAGRASRSRPNSGQQYDPKSSQPEPLYQGETDGSYNYDRSQNTRRAPEGVATKLPKTPRWKTIQDMRQSGQDSGGELPATPSTTNQLDIPAVPPPNTQNVPGAVPEPQNPATIEGGNPSK